MKSIYLVFKHFIELHLALNLVVRLGGRLLALARAEHHAAAVLGMVDGLILNFIDRFHSYNHIEHAIYSEDIANDHYQASEYTLLLFCISSPNILQLLNIQAFDASTEIIIDRCNFSVDSFLMTPTVCDCSYEIYL